MRELGDRLLQVQGYQAAASLGMLPTLNLLGDAAFKVSSQWGEDGIIEWLVQALPIRARSFIEFGVGNYTESNTRFLLQRHNWRGLVIDCDQSSVNFIKRDAIMWRHDLTAVCAFITKDSINDLFVQNGFVGDIGILSVDVDGNDYWIWESISCVNPAIVICEYNAVFGDCHRISVPYSPDFRRTVADPSNLYYGASIGAMEFLAQRKGYRLAGTNVEGSNAFFVRDDLFKSVADRIQSCRPRPSLFRESRDAAGVLTYCSGLERAKLIADRSVVLVDTGEVTSLGRLENLYSDDWVAGMCVTSHGPNANGNFWQ